ncbi:hypothetical protein BU24DRAFT_424927 [Aaosphaeria arxii CBS 175.79]|uniref:Uncharacterized protein n=1 Tax=Aaosphaeria arxii CBS 175.79 TaxID=1450172 RepID=A0A6A5XNH1_9PLEO|nr:uncharacterized protein BU24DRAFT_424927 [Aaosphaeria arxii CBS 175.79]KAF2013904.1 hypothetical protein BU24DRAFT_424927 [Aaosphaeria arxii CBS 175.79]
MSTTASDKPHVLLVSLDTDFPFDQIYQASVGKLKALATLHHATNPASALQRLEHQPLQAVLVTDGAIAQHRAVFVKLLDYVRGGGTLVLMGTFSSMTRPNDMNKLFQEAGLPWTYRDCRRINIPHYAARTTV